MSSNASETDPKRAKMLEHLARAREKAAEKRRMLGELTRKEKAEKEKIIQDRLKNLALMEKTNNQQQQEKDEEPEKTTIKTKKKHKKTIKKIIEISDSSSGDDDDDDTESGSDDDAKVQYVVKRKSRKGVKPKKQEYETSRLTAEVAKDLLKQKVLSDTHREAFASLFPLHRF